MTTIKDAMPHGDLSEVFPDVFFVTGTSRPVFEGSPWQFSRNMIVVRAGDELTLVNTVRLDEAGLAGLEALGTVSKVVKLGSFHGMDDPFYTARYGVKLWAPAGMQHDNGLTTDVEMTVGGSMPFESCSMFLFETSKTPEAVLRLDREGGILVACDSLQNWTGPDRFFDDASAKTMAEHGFFRAANIGPGWLRYSEPAPADFRRLLAMDFKHLLSAHGEPLKDVAHGLLAETIKEKLGVDWPTTRK